MKISVIIPVWNGREYLPACLDALLAQGDAELEIIAVDNASADGSATLVRERYPQVRLIENERNLGFAGGCNAGLRAAQDEYLILVNQDVIVHQGWLQAMLKALAPPSVGIVGCKLLYPDGTIQHAGGIMRYPSAQPNHYGYREPDCGQWDTLREVDYVTGAAMGLRRTVLDKVGFFDEGFFPAFYEEADLCLRARAAGYQVIYTPDAVATHAETTTVERNGAEYHRWMGRGRLRFLLKHYTAAQFHDDFVPAERAWLGSLTDPAMRRGLWMAYLDTLLNLRDIPRTGVLVEEGSAERVAEVLTDLCALLTASFDKPAEVAPAPASLAALPWCVQERPFTSKIPVIGPAIARFRELWNSVATKWYVRPLIEQQNEINRQLVLEIGRVREELEAIRGRLEATRGELEAAQEIIVSLDRETVDRHRIQVRATYALQEEMMWLSEKVRTLETASSSWEQEP
jgi:GT2 family glycosyltransferase